MSDETDIQHIELGKGTVAQLLKLPQQMIDYLWERIDVAKKKKINVKKDLAGNISQSYKLEDPQNLVIRNLYNIVFNSVDNPKMFEFINMEIQNSYKRIGLKNVMLEPYLSGLWVNFQKKGEFQPIHIHNGILSFVIWMDIPYHSKDEAKLPFAKSGCEDPPGGNFSFPIPDSRSRSVKEYFIQMSPEKNGYCCFFPSDLSHQVYPFYTSDKDRISISGNIMYRPEEPNHLPTSQYPFRRCET